MTQSQHILARQLRRWQVMNDRRHMEIFARISEEYQPALLAALPEPGLMLTAEIDQPGYVTLLEDEAPKDLSDFWNRFEIGKRALNNAGIISQWERDLPALLANLKAKRGCSQSEVRHDV